MSDTVEDTIQRLEDARYRAMQESDTAALGKLLSDGLMVIHSTGGTDDKERFLKKLSERTLSYERIERTGTRVVCFGESVAHVVGRVRMDCKVNGRDITIDNTIVAVWVLDGDAWKLASAQSTPTPK